MKIFKKLRLGLLLATAVAILGLFLGHSQASAAGVTYTAAWLDRSNIKVTGSDGTSITLTDGAWDNTWDYTANWSTDGCQVEINGFGTNQIVGLTQRNGNPPWDAAASQAKLTVQHLQGTSCAPVAGYNKQSISIGDPQNAQIMFAWLDSGTIGRVDGNTDFTFSNPQKQADGSTWFTRNSEAGATKCRDILVVGTQNLFGNILGVTLYELNNNDPGTGQKAPANIDPTQTCYLQNTVKSLIALEPFDAANSAVPSGVNLPLGGQANASKPPGTGGSGGTADGTQPDTCELSSNGFSFAWLMCPLLLAGQEISDNLINAFEDQLSFNVNQNLGDQNSQASVEKTWSLVKNLATAFLVIIILIMVISQAVGGGPFDAYTVRKMLPRLVAVAIAIQLSWAMVSWVIDVFDDLGRGIADIMYFSFGGSDALSLGHILAHANIGSYTAGTISWVGVIGLIGLSIAALPAVLVFLLIALAAMVTALVTLILRKVIIIVLLIFAPIALLAYVLPGTQRYWKLWVNNFIKILAMFPLVVILVAAGRVFAYIVGTQDNAALLNFLFVMVGFFGPLFFLPKTFKWGGQALSFAADGVSNFTNRFAGKESALGKGVRGYGERVQGSRAKEYDPNAHWTKRAFRRVQSGHMLPTERSRRLAIAAGNKWAEERNEEANALATRIQEKSLTGYNKYDNDRDGQYVQFARNADGKLIDAAGNEVQDIDHAAVLHVFGTGKAGQKAAHAAGAFETLTGVEAGKQALIDAAGNSGSKVVDKRLAQAAQKLLLDTSSEIELQGAQVQGGDNQGRRVTEVSSWKSNITSSPPHYSAINRTRADFAPDLIESAEGAASRYLGRQVEYGAANAADRKVIDKYRLKIALDRLTPEQMQNMHYGFYQDIARMEDSSLSDQLRQKVEQFKYEGGTIGSSAAGSLRGGREKHVDAALSYATPVGPGTPAPRGAPARPAVPTVPTLGNL